MTAKGNITKLSLLLLIGIALFWMDLFSGVPISIEQLLDPDESQIHKLFWQIRLPRVINAMLVGVGLSISGLAMQILFRNPLAGPSILGVNAGATLLVALFLLTLTGSAFLAEFEFASIGSAVLIFSVLGALMVLILIGVFSLWLKSNISLLISGLLFSYFSIAIVSLMQFFASPDKLQDFIFWTFGSLASQSNTNLLLMTIIVACSFVVMLLYANRLNAFLLGEDYAVSLGIDVKKMKWLLIIITACITGVLTAICGPIAFVGMAVPHLARLLFKTNDTRILLLAIFIIGCDLMLLSDAVSRSGDSIVFPINAITALLGTPVILFYIFRTRTRNVNY